MKEDIDEWAETLENYGGIEQIRDMYKQLEVNVNQLDQLMDAVERAEAANDLEALESMYENEFKLLIENIGIYEDLTTLLDTVEKTPENEFELARIRRDLGKLIVVEITEI